MSQAEGKIAYASVIVGPAHALTAVDIPNTIFASLGGKPHRLKILSDASDHYAVEVICDLGSADLRNELMAHLEREVGAFADWCLLPLSERRKSLLICDMDSTIIQQECLDELADFAGLKAEVSAITERAMAGELDFDTALTERVAMLEGLALSTLETCYRERIDLMPGARALVQTMAKHGAHCLLVSGGFTFFTERVAAAAGFHAHRANRLLDDGARLTGKVARPILDRAAKKASLDAAVDIQKLSPSDALAIGDGANDLDMIQAAGLGIAYRAKPIVAAAAGVAIRHTDLRTALYFQGYGDSEITTFPPR